MAALRALPAAVPPDRDRPGKTSVSPTPAFVGLLIALSSAPVAAQGVTGAAVAGRVFGSDSAPVAEAVVLVTNGSNGERWRTTTNARGRYFVEHLSVGGPYRIEVQAIGFEPTRREGVFLTLGQRLTADMVLISAVVRLQEITVSGPEDPRFSAARTGPAQVISDSTIARLPVRGRDYTELALLSPQVTRSANGGLSFAGQHDRYNSIQVDGTNNNDLFGSTAAGNGTLGWAVGLSAFTPEAVEELQVISAPFDVRYGNFAGGLINAVTKSGTNRVEGSILGHLESSDLVGTVGTGSRGEDFSHTQLGLTLGAPIVRNRVALFLNAAMERHVLPQAVPAPTSDTTGGADSAGVGIRYESVVRLRDLLQGYGADAGNFSAGANRTPTHNLFVKVTAQLGVNSRLAVSHTYGHGEGQDGTLGRGYGYYPLSSAGAENPETIHATRLTWTTAFGRRFSNELVLARVDDRRTCAPNSDFPLVSVMADMGELIAGRAEGCSGAETRQTVWELTDNFGLAAGDHRLTVGTHGELIDLVDDVVEHLGGVWFFDSLDSLAQGEPARYLRDSAIAGAQVAFRVNQIGAYTQDQWTPTPRLTLTAGLRLDVPFLPTPPTQNPLALGLGVNTALTPSGNILWSPRLGVNYDLSGRGIARLRGGVGLFAGHPAYQWFREVYARTGTRALTMDCTGDAVPPFTLDPANQPTACLQEDSFARLNYFDPEFRFPQNLKLAVGADILLPWGVVGTFDFLYTRGVNTFQTMDVSLHGPHGVANGEAGRAMYGAIDSATAEAIPSRRTKDELEAVFEIRNGSGDRAFSIGTQLAKRFANGAELSAAYTYTDAEDRGSSSTDTPGPNISSAPVNGTLEHPEVRTSLWEKRHKVTLVGTTDLPLGFRLGLTYIGGSSTPFTYVVDGDANADGFWSVGDPSNDVVYVPRNAADIALLHPSEFAQLDRLIQGEPCLRNQRGRLLERNSCHDPWVHETQARLAKQFRLAGSRKLEVTADLFNLLNFLSGNWGFVRRTQGGYLSGYNSVSLLELVGYDASNGRGVYRLVPGATGRYVDVEASRWRLQLGATLSF